MPLNGCVSERFHDRSKGSNGQHGVTGEDKSEPEPIYTTRAEVDILAQAARQRRSFSHDGRSENSWNGKRSPGWSW
ncbi:MAG TPA: hypothetical protein VIM11_07265, partial [Tepidisphaeraceae bacterium]